MRIILDTNVFISGIFWSGPPSKIFDAWVKNKVKLVISPEILDEYKRVAETLYKKNFESDLAPIFNLIIF